MDIQHILRAEKDAHLLTKLDENIYEVTQATIKALESEMATADDLELELLKQDIRSSMQCIKMLQDRRIEKVIKAAVSDAYRSERKHTNDFMLPNERNLYNCIIQGISDIRS